MDVNQDFSKKTTLFVELVITNVPLVKLLQTNVKLVVMKTETLMTLVDVNLDFMMMEQPTVNLVTTVVVLVPVPMELIVLTVLTLTEIYPMIVNVK